MRQVVRHLNMTASRREAVPKLNSDNLALGPCTVAGCKAYPNWDVASVGHRRRGANSIGGLITMSRAPFWGIDKVGTPNIQSVR